MKLQYLCDAKDAFKWDYLDFLTKEMGLDLYIVPMLTPDDDTGHGNIPSREFPASDGVAKFCCWLRKDENKKLASLRKLPTFTSSGGVAKFCRWLLKRKNRKIKSLCKLLSCIRSDYKVKLHKPCVTFCESERDSYFDNMLSGEKHILFLDPDTGFEPNTAKEKHVKYLDIETIWRQISEDAIVVVFQHTRYDNNYTFSKHYKEIKSKLSHLIPPPCSTAMCWIDNVMLVVLGKSSARIEKVREINNEYQRTEKPVCVVGE